MGDAAGQRREIPDSTIRDLSDFCESWPELRGLVLDHLERDEVSDPQVASVIAWLCHLCDRVYYQPPNET